MFPCNKSNVYSPTTSSFGFGTSFSDKMNFTRSPLAFGSNIPSNNNNVFQTSTPFIRPTMQPDKSFFNSTPPPGTGSNYFCYTQNNISNNEKGLFSQNGLMLGQQSKTPSYFGFGSSATNTSFFGQEQQPFGTFGHSSNSCRGITSVGTVIKYSPVSGTDSIQKCGITHSVNTKLNCITVMKEYEAKSLEELRWDDYQCNRKDNNLMYNTPVSTSFPFFNQKENRPIFGQPIGMGQTNQSVFEKNSFTPSTMSGFNFNLNSTLRGSGNDKPFGLPLNNVFQPVGQATPFTIQPTMQPVTQAQPTALKNVFGFGQSNSVLQTNNFFNKSVTQPSFGVLQPAQQTHSTCFQQSPSFGKTAPTSFSNVFGQSPQNSSNIFQTSLQPTVNPSFLQTRLPVDTQAHANPANAAFGGNKYFSGFSPKNNYTPLSFCNPSMVSQNGPTFISSSETIDLKAPPDLHILVGNLYEAFPYRKIFENIDGNKYINSNSTNFSSPEKEAVKVVATAREPITTSTKQNLFIKPTKSSHYDSNKLILLMDTVNETTMQDKNFILPKTNVKRLLLNKKNLEDKNDIIRNNKFNEELNKQLDLDQKLVLNQNNEYDLKSSASTTPMIQQCLNEYKDSSPQQVNINERKELKTSCVHHTDQTDQMKKKNVSLFTYTNTEKLAKPDAQSVGETSMKTACESPKSNVEHDLINNNANYLKCVVNNKNEDLCGIKLKRADYYTIPTLAEIYKFRNEKGECLVKGFTIGRHGYGKVCFPEEINVSNLDLDAIVEFSFREITVYPDDSQKPPEGQGLNRPAEITLEHVWPRHSLTHEVIKDPKEIDKYDFMTRLNLLSERQNAKLVNYSADTGKWVFYVEHFTKYHFDEDIDKNIALELNNGICGVEPKVTYSNAEPEITLVESNISRSLLLLSTNKDYERLVLLKSALFKDESASDICSKNGNLVSWELSDDLVKVTRKNTIQPKYYPLLNNYYVTPIQNSLKISHNYVDMALFKSKSFKIGWGPKCSFFILNMKSPSKLHSISTMKIKNQSSKSHMMDLEQHLNAVFEESTITIDKFGIPLFTLKENYKLLIQHQNIANSLNEDNMRMPSYYTEVWNLCLALWGPNATSPTSRCALFSKWLEECVASYLNNEINFCTITNIFNYLTGHNIKEAAELAMANEFPQLSLLISQAGTNENFKLLMNHQMEQWHNNGMLNLINNEILKIYSLLSGIDNISDINIYDKLEWKRTLAMHLWYATSTGTSFIRAIQAYNKNIESLSYINLPIPDYCGYGMTYDILYHIMILFINPTMVLEKVINPNNYTDDPLDYRLSWLLLQIFIPLRVGSISEEVINTVHTSFASQLENLGLWKWSVFVLLFIKDKTVKENAILQVLSRNLKLTIMNDLATEDFLVNDLKIPREWIHSSLIMKSDLLEANVQNYKHYVFISDWYKAHEIAMNSLIPEFTLMGQYEKLLDILKTLIPGKKNIALWHTQVGLMLDILKLHRDINKMESVSSQQLLVLKQHVVELCFRIKHFPLMTLKHSFIISKFSKFVTTLLKILYCKLPQLVLETVPEFAYLIKILHMPPDYKYNELMECVYHHVREEAFM